jgi:hypothetical protein
LSPLYSESSNDWDWYTVIYIAVVWLSWSFPILKEMVTEVPLWIFCIKVNSVFWYLWCYTDCGWEKGNSCAVYMESTIVTTDSWPHGNKCRLI